MPSGIVIISALLAALVILVLACLWLLLRGTGRGSGEDSDVLSERLSARQAEAEDLRSQLNEAREEAERLRETNVSLREQQSRLQTRLEEERGQHEEKVKLLHDAREQMSLQFKNLANEILEQKGKSFTDLNKQNIQNILKPLSERIQQFEKKVEETYSREAKERFSLAREIKTLQELNTRISEDAVNLTNALKGESKTQGVWGEVILERVLERSGLTRGREYEVQVSLKTEDGRARQPDVIVHLPENKDVIIDAKVSLSAYEKYSAEDDPPSRDEYLKQHIQSIRGHIKRLSEKNYHNIDSIRSLDFVMMFLPVEAAFTLAVQHDSNLFTEAFERNIILVGPTTLLATLRTIQNIWRYEYQNKNALDIAERAGALYDKFVGFVHDLEEVGKRIDQTQAAYDEAHKKLTSGRGNLVGNVEKLKVLGARASKQLPDSVLDRAGGEDELLEGGDDDSDAGDRTAS